jgi:hypothetical protein
VGFSVREDKVFVYKFKACLLVAGGCVNIFRPRSVGQAGVWAKGYMVDIWGQTRYLCGGDSDLAGSIAEYTCP